ncbi:hypothetical protein [Paenibacillus terrigena]|uniref:hypothetical protein n=1 Tax=Paenibacillus terrigena TaxID=369333 RepID=UPI0028D43CCB|nr:hypothetical protein [Paenibacillus terrigena]
MNPNATSSLYVTSAVPATDRQSIFGNTRNTARYMTMISWRRFLHDAGIALFTHVHIQLPERQSRTYPIV